jgi:hypothetical protein
MSDEQRDDYRQRLGREGVQNGDNHKEGEWDSGHGHGCLGKLEQHSQHGSGGKKKEEWDDKIATAAADAIIDGVTNVFSGVIPQMLNPNAKQSDNDNSGGPGGFLGAAAAFVGGILNNDDNSSSRRSPPDTRQSFNDHSSSYDRPNSTSDSQNHYPGHQGYDYQDRSNHQDYRQHSYQENHHYEQPPYQAVQDSHYGGSSYGKDPHVHGNSFPSSQGENASYFHGATDAVYQGHNHAPYHNDSNHQSGYGADGHYGGERGYPSHDQQGEYRGSAQYREEEGYYGGQGGGYQGGGYQGYGHHRYS